MKYLLLLERTDIPPSASSLFERGQELNQYVFTLNQIVFWYNRLKSCTLDVEFSMIENEMLIIDEKLKPAEEEYSWASQGPLEFIYLSISEILTSLSRFYMLCVSFL